MSRSFLPMRAPRDALIRRRLRQVHRHSTKKWLRFAIAAVAVVWPEFLALSPIGTALFGYAPARFRNTLRTMA